MHSLHGWLADLDEGEEVVIGGDDLDLAMHQEAEGGGSVPREAPPGAAPQTPTSHAQRPRCKG